MKISWIARPTNKKTGCIPTAYVGESIAEARQSCIGCPLLPDKDKERDDDSECYAWQGTPKLGFGAMIKAVSGSPHGSIDGAERYSLEYAMENRHPDAKASRMFALGDGARVPKKLFHRTARTIRKAGLAIVGYTHFWREYKNRGLKRDLMASCDNTKQADKALAQGWRAAAIVPADTIGPIVYTPEGEPGLICPAQLKDTVTCNDCKLCDPQHPIWKLGKILWIAFRDHTRRKAKS